MKTVLQLPEGYSEAFDIDLQKNKRLALVVNGLSLLIGAVMVAIPLVFFEGARSALTEDFSSIMLKYGVCVIGIIAYIFLHELVHGICFKYFSGVKAHYGFTGLYAYAGSEAFYCKSDYLVIALAPVVVWGIVLAVLNIVLPVSWFWPVYFIQVCNIGGAAGDMYVTYKMAKLPKDILVNDKGVSMAIYAPASFPN